MIHVETKRERVVEKIAEFLKCDGCGLRDSLDQTKHRMPKTWGFDTSRGWRGVWWQFRRNLRSLFTLEFLMRRAASNDIVRSNWAVGYGNWHYDPAWFHLCPACVGKVVPALAEHLSKEKQ